MNKESLKEYLSSRYQGWSSFLNNVIFPIFGEDDFEDGFETELLVAMMQTIVYIKVKVSLFLVLLVQPMH